MLANQQINIISASQQINIISANQQINIIHVYYVAGERGCRRFGDCEGKGGGVCELIYLIYFFYIFQT